MIIIEHILYKEESREKVGASKVVPTHKVRTAYAEVRTYRENSRRRMKNLLLLFCLLGLGEISPHTSSSTVLAERWLPRSLGSFYLKVLFSKINRFESFVFL